MQDMAQTSEQLLHWVTAELPVLRARLAHTRAAIRDARRRLEAEI
jgi:hypothetical protein